MRREKGVGKIERSMSKEKFVGGVGVYFNSINKVFCVGGEY